MTTTNTELKSEIITAENRSHRMQEAFQDEKSRFAEEFVQDMHTSPIAKLLDLIGSLPEIRHEKVENVRHQINSDSYDMNHNLDSAIDMMLEEFLTDC